MRILCDQHVPTKYVQAFEQESWLTVSTVAEELSPDVADADIAGRHPTTDRTDHDKNHKHHDRMNAERRP